MLEEVALVIHADEQHLLVQTKTRSGCSHCGSSSECGTSVLGKLFSAKVNQIQVDNSLGVKVGERVIIGIPDGFLVSAALLGYLLPLVVMLLVTIASDAAGASDLAQSLFAISGLALGLFMARKISEQRKLRDNFKPILLAVADQISVPVKLMRQ